MIKVKNTGTRGTPEKELVPAQKDILSFIDDMEIDEDTTPWEGTLRDYLPLVIDSPELNESSHSRVWRMVESAGVEFDEDDVKKKNPRYNFFDEDLFGVNSVLADVMEYFKAAAAGSDVARRILLLWGPTSSGKSQFAILLKRGLEAFSRTKEGAIYALSDSPMYENPLVAIPRQVRAGLRKQYGLVIEGDPSPRVAWILENTYGGDFWKLPVKRVFLSEQNRIGIGTFQPGDTKCIAGDSLVLLEDSLIEILNLGVENEDALDVKVLTKDNELKTTKTFFRYEDRDIVNVSTNLGYTISCTPNHPLMTVNGAGEFQWKNVEDMSVGDTLVMSNGVWPESFTQTDSKLGWTNDFAKFLGLYVAEGCFYKPRYTTMEISNHSPEVHKIVKDAMLSVGNIPITMRRDNRGVLVNNKVLIKTMMDWGFTTGAHQKCIPEVVFKSGKVKEFLHGLWLGDGNVGRHANKNTNEAIYSTVSTILARQVHTLLLLMGIPSKLTFDSLIGTSGAYKILVTGNNVNKLVQELNIPKWKFTRDLTDVENNTNIMLMPRIDELSTSIMKSATGLSSWHRYAVSTRSYGRRFSQDSLKRFITEAEEKGCKDTRAILAAKELSKDKYLFVTIDKLSMSKGDVFDIEVPDGHEFIANGFVSHNSQSQSELVGSVNFAKLEDFGVESHPMAYNFDGELNVANRGLMEFIEMLKVDPKFRHILLTLAQEKQIKVERFPLIYADLVPLAHTNETEYNKFLANKSEEALHDRLWLIKFPYNLSLDSEVKIYEKLILGTPGFQKIHIAPHTLKVAAMFAVLSRIEEPKDKGVTMLQKLHLYNGDKVDGFTKDNLKDLHREAVREGLDGVSPRYIVNRLAACFARHGITSITPIEALRSVKDGLCTNAKLDKDEVVRLENIISLCVEEYNKIACNEVQKAFFLNFEGEVKNLLDNYIDNVGCYLNDSKVENEWGEYDEPDERLMRNVEGQIGITDSGKDSFRQEVYRKVLEEKSRVGKFDYQSHPKLKEALQKQLFEERSDVIRLTVSTRNPDPEGLKKINEVAAVLIDKFDYNAESANELLRYVSNIMSKSS